MDKIFITNQAGERLEVGVARFFEYNDTAFLIYTLSETDENNYVKLYVTKVNVDNVQSITITEEAEWSLFKDVMKGIIKSNKNNMPLQVTDLDPKTINNIVIYDSKVFKLNGEMVNYLQMNKKSVETVEEVKNVTNNIPDVFAISQDSNIEETTTQQKIEPEVNDNIENQNESMEVSIPEIPADVVFGVINAKPKKDVANQNIEPQLTSNEINEVNNVFDVIPETVSNIQTIVESNQPSEISTTIPLEQNSIEEEKNEINELTQKISMLEKEIDSLNAKLEQIKNIIG